MVPAFLRPPHIAAGNRFGPHASGAGSNLIYLRIMKTNHLAYHEARAEEELALAQNATSPGAVRAHVALAEMHLEILYDPPTSESGMPDVDRQGGITCTQDQVA